jgi:hypothetical protein
MQGLTEDAVVVASWVGCQLLGWFECSGMVCVFSSSARSVGSSKLARSASSFVQQDVCCVAHIVFLWGAAERVSTAIPSQGGVFKQQQHFECNNSL